MEQWILKIMLTLIVNKKCLIMGLIDKMLKSFDEEAFKNQLQKLEEPAQPLQGTTEMKSYVPHKRKRRRRSKIKQAEDSIKKSTQLKTNTQNENECMELSELTLAALPINGVINTK
ncbi:unnamed protein product [Ceratitis capitata]|uniref:(Mediterranean fruit fly) hypothetical protein n=1 Tax=Ceratitis capitata TaxID=7213 RepID=A0A811V7Y1_CERCA|nr:unnamed protein product [Ceratitis capitata]